MTPKKAIIIVLVMFSIMGLVFVSLYFKGPTINPVRESGAGAGQTSGGANKTTPLAPAEKVQQKINKIYEEAAKNPAQNAPAKVRQEVISTINQAIIQQEQSKTPEQKAADAKAAEERQRIIDQINNQIK